MTVISNLLLLAKWQISQTLLKYLLTTVIAFDLPPSPPQTLKQPDGITFDPLGVAAILHNPRAESSAARLYAVSKRDKHLFRWPHTTMFGGALVPLKTLVEHMTANMTSLHPAVTLCMKDTVMVTVSLTDERLNEHLPLTFSQIWLRDAVAFVASEFHPQNDITIVHLDENDAPEKELESNSLLLKLVILLTGYMTGALIAGAVVWSVLTADYWAVTLFAVYFLHWLSSTAISHSEIVTYETPTIGGQLNFQTTYALHERLGGGIIVFKGPAVVFEKLARSRWTFKKSFKNNFLHWFWMISGTLSAIASVAAMVNMLTELQLAFLAILSYSSVAEIWIMWCARSAQFKALASLKGRRPTYKYLTGKSKFTHSIIHASLGVADDDYRLDKLDWIKRKKLPPDFQPLLDLLSTLNDLLSSNKGEYSVDERRGFREAVKVFETAFPKKYDGLVKGILTEVELAWDSRLENGQTEGSWKKV